MTSHARPPRHGIYARLGIIVSALGVAIVAAVVWVAFRGSSRTDDSNAVAAHPAAPASTVTLTATATAVVTAPPVTPSAQPVTPVASSSAPPKEITYTVRAGDNLFLIAQWFHQNGYQPIYDWNRTVIGQDPGLIRPGQVFVVAVEPSS
jgi:nucleoid-associated protein YgaU